MLLKAVLYIISLLWFGLLTYVGIDNYSYAPDIIERDREFIAKALTPKVEFVEAFRSNQDRLPTLEEFNSSLEIRPNEYETYIREASQVPSEIRDDVKDLDWSSDYVIAVWRGEWFEFYISEGERYITNDFDYSDAIQNMIITIGIGLLPLMAFLMYQIKNNKQHLITVAVAQLTEKEGKSSSS